MYFGSAIIMQGSEAEKCPNGSQGVKRKLVLFLGSANSVSVGETFTHQWV